MNKISTIAKVVGVTLIVAASSQAMAEEATGNASVTVQNSFTFEETTALSFGIIQVSADITSAAGASKEATLTISADTEVAPISTTDPLAKLAVIEAGTPGTFTISGVGPYSRLTITLPNSEPLKAQGSPLSTDAQFTVGSFTAMSTTGTSSAVVGGTDLLLADESGSATFAVGATLTTDVRGSTLATTNYGDGIYEGTFTITASY